MKLNINGLFNRAGGTREANKELDKLIEALLKLNTKEEMEDFLRGILTPKELIELPNRLEIIKLLKQGVSQHDVAGKLGVGVATVTRGSMEIQKGRFKNV
jgi:TrpR family transcriptional regulator, trp operon repressor